uniref:Uncharacterized protein n=1 Tax=Amphimedon queenslandica TaxID=400682 RepID=A0A1X7UXE0_AMPQE
MAQELTTPMFDKTQNDWLEFTKRLGYYFVANAIGDGDKQIVQQNLPRSTLGSSERVLQFRDILKLTFIKLILNPLISHCQKGVRIAKQFVMDVVVNTTNCIAGSKKQCHYGKNRGHFAIVCRKKSQQKHGDKTKAEANHVDASDDADDHSRLQVSTSFTCRLMFDVKVNDVSLEMVLTRGR